MGDRETVAYVALSHAAYSFDGEYSYLVPERYRQVLKAGMRVLVSFGRGNNRVIGLVTRLGYDDDNKHKLKPVISVIDKESLVTDEMMKIIFWLKENTFCTYYDAFKSAVPTGFSYKVDMHFALVNTYIDRESLSTEEAEIVGFLESCDDAAEIDKYFDLKANPQRKKPLDTLIDKGYVEEVPSFKRKVGDDSVKMAVLNDGYEDADLTPKQKKVVELLEESGSASVKELCYMTGCTSTIIKRLCEKEVLRVYEQEVLRNAVGELGDRESPEDIVLNDEQKMAYNGIMTLIRAGKPAGALLYGVTGSGKTSVFIRVIDSVVKMGKTAIMLVPEISLTPQMLARFKVLFGENIALLHSSLSLGQRMDEFKRIKRGEARIIIGTRSAVFAPAENIGVIIMDEEGEQSYKSDSNPRYHARDVAIQRCGHNGALLLMASATPSLETFYHAQKGRFHL